MKENYLIDHNLLGMQQMGNFMSLAHLRALRNVMEDHQDRFQSIHRHALEACIESIEHNVMVLEKEFPWLIQDRIDIEEAANATHND